MTFNDDVSAALSAAGQTITASHASEVTALQATIDTQRQTITEQQATITDLRNQLANSQPSGTSFFVGQSVPGADAAARTKAVQDAQAAGMKGFRIFYGGALPTNPSTDAWLKCAKEGELWVVSYKTALTAAQATAFVKAWKAMTKATLVLCWHHEPENDTGTLPPAEFRKTTDAQRQLVQGAGAQYATILMAYTLSPGSGRTLSDWLVPGVDFLGFDAYNVGSDKGIYTDPSKITGPCKAAATQAGVKWMICETGSPDLGTVAGQTRAQWAAALVTQARKDGAVAVLWWNQQAAGGGKDYRLDPATTKALVTAGK